MNYRFTLSETLLVAINLIPVAGVLLWGWSIFTLFFLYWAETAVIGILNIPKMMIVATTKKSPESIVLIPFYIVHFGAFSAVHLFFITTILAKGPNELATTFIATVMIAATKTVFALLLIAISHATSFFTNFLQHNEYRHTTIQKQMMAPYPRTIVMHLSLFLAAFVLEITKLPSVLALSFIVITKIGSDLYAHRSEHKSIAKV